MEKEYMETIPFKIDSKKKYLGVNLTKDVNDLYKEDYKPLKKEIEEDYRRWRHLHAHGLVESTQEKWLYTTKSNLHI
jgi:hypothetical protein